MLPRGLWRCLGWGCQVGSLWPCPSPSTRTGCLYLLLSFLRQIFEPVLGP